MENLNLGNTKGISRKIDDLGRIVIPMEFRKELGISAEDREWLEMFLFEDGVFVKKKKFLYKEAENEDVNN